VCQRAGVCGFGLVRACGSGRVCLLAAEAMRGWMDGSRGWINNRVGGWVGECVVAQHELCIWVFLEFDTIMDMDMGHELV
jgi:hypothetical protein